MQSLAQLSVSGLLLLLLEGALTSPAPSLWPLPTHFEDQQQLSALSQSFQFQLPPQAPSMLVEACLRYRALMLNTSGFAKGSTPITGQMAVIEKVTILATSWNTTLELGTDEGYTLTVLASSAGINASSPFGVLRGLETLSQLVVATGYLANAQISDSPRFQHRELLLDTARYYIPISYIQRTVDAMAYSKLNVLHWHPIDAQSFSLQTEAYPELEQEGAFKPHSHLCASDSCSYTKQQVQGLVEYCEARGVKLVIEVDSPGHAASWGKAYSNLTVNGCTMNKDQIPINPTLSFARKVVSAVVAEAARAARGQKHLVHLGGDEVDLSCWEKNDQIAEYMKQYNLTAGALLTQWLGQISDDVHSAYPSATRVYWEDAFEYKPALDKHDVFQVWKDESSLMAISRAGFSTIKSSGWYVHSNSHWVDFYTQEPFNSTWTEQEKRRVLGGGVSKWGCSGFCPFPDTADEVETKLWPIAAVVAERLWSPAHVTDQGDALRRLQAHRTRLLNRGLHVGAIK